MWNSPVTAPLSLLSSMTPVPETPATTTRYTPSTPTSRLLGVARTETSSKLRQKFFRVFVEFPESTKPGLSELFIDKRHNVLVCSTTNNRQKVTTPEQAKTPRKEIIMKKLLALAIAGILTAGLNTTQAAEYGSKKTIVETAVSAGKFNTLVAAVKAAGLAEALSGEGPFTVFAPTDEAFAKLPEGKVESLLKPENKKLLQTILKYHVVKGSNMAATVVEMKSAQTLCGQVAPIKVSDEGAYIGKAKITATDIKCSNGVIHVIDTVILPETKNIAEVAVEAGSFKTLVAALKATGLADAIATGGPFTVFAPTDEAFGKLPEGTVETLLKEENLPKLAAILKYHVVEGFVPAATASKLDSAKTLSGEELSIKAKWGKVMINDAKVIKADVNAFNGIIHVVDTVILPES